MISGSGIVNNPNSQHPRRAYLGPTFLVTVSLASSLASRGKLYFFERDYVDISP
jgi:hypothetical protein